MSRDQVNRIVDSRDAAMGLHCHHAIFEQPRAAPGTNERFLFGLSRVRVRLDLRLQSMRPDRPIRQDGRKIAAPVDPGAVVSAMGSALSSA